MTSAWSGARVSITTTRQKRRAAAAVVAAIDPAEAARLKREKHVKKAIAKKARAVDMAKRGVFKKKIKKRRDFTI